MSKTEPDLEWKKRTARDEHLAELRKMKIGPIFPSDPDHRPGMQGSRKENRLGKDTKPPYRRRRKR